jgi:hypothetical protein
MFGRDPPEYLMSFLAPSTSEVRRRRILVGGASVLITAIVMTGFILESRWGYSPKDLNIIYMQNWRADRTRDEVRADAAATIAAQDQRLADSRAYIATLSGKAKIDAQKQYDDYVAGGGVKKDVPYVPAASASGSVAIEPPVE